MTVNAVLSQTGAFRTFYQLRIGDKLQTSSSQLLKVIHNVCQPRGPILTEKSWNSLVKVAIIDTGCNLERNAISDQVVATVTEAGETRPEKARHRCLA